MDTYYAPPGIASDQQLDDQLQAISSHPVISELLQIINGLVAILNSNRQITAINDDMLRALNVKKPEKVFGLRLGEAVHCVHAHEVSGCGTTEYCMTCGAAIAMVTALCNQTSAERICSITANENGKAKDLFFKVSASCLTIEYKPYILIFLQDVTTQQNRALLERVFFHDLNNTIMSLNSTTRMLMLGDRHEHDTLIRQVNRLSNRLSREVHIHQALINQSYEYKIQYQQIPVIRIFNELTQFFADHPVAADKTLLVEHPLPNLYLSTDETLTLRILTNMVLNALEASNEGDMVKVWLIHDGDHLTFHVWNKEAIPKRICLRIFQKNFSTHEGFGRGFGTYSMKLFGEKYLGGTVDFVSSPSEGTTFSFSLPIKPLI